MSKIFMVSKKVLNDADKVIFTADMINERGEQNVIVLEVSDDELDITIKVDALLEPVYFPAVVINEEAAEMPQAGDA